MNLDGYDLEALLKRLNLAYMRRSYRDVIARAEAETWTYRDFLTLMAAEEVAQRQQTRIQRFVRKAHFPFLKTIDEFNFTYQTSLRLNTLGSYLSPDFVTDGRCLILHGKSGRGKTHLAVAIAYKAIQNGFEALFTTAAELLDDLSRASRHGDLVDRLAVYTHPHVLIIDELGYLSLGPDAANVLFHVVNNRHLRRRPMIFTTNKTPRNWGKVLHDDDLAEAIVDRVMERGRLIHLDGPSIRNPRADENNTDDRELPGQDLKPARISGKLRPELPEPARENGSRFGRGPAAHAHPCRGSTAGRPGRPRGSRPRQARGAETCAICLDAGTGSVYTPRRVGDRSHREGSIRGSQGPSGCFLFHFCGSFGSE